MDNQENIDVENYFCTPVYSIYKPNFLSLIKKVSKKHLKNVKDNQKLNSLYPVFMSNNFYNDPDAKEFCDFVGNLAWDILNTQGYNLNNLNINFTEMWTQEHYKYSSMDQHVHGNGSQIVGCYFLKVPKESPNILFYDPRIGKVQNNLLEKNEQELNVSSSIINVKPREGLLVFTNSWLAHAFTKNPSNKPFKFVHFNLKTFDAITESVSPEVEIV